MSFGVVKVLTVIQNRFATRCGCITCSVLFGFEIVMLFDEIAGNNLEIGHCDVLVYATFDKLELLLG